MKSFEMAKKVFLSWDNIELSTILVWIPGLKVTETSEQREGEGSNCAPRIFSPSITSLTNPKLAWDLSWIFWFLYLALLDQRRWWNEMTRYFLFEFCCSQAYEGRDSKPIWRRPHDLCPNCPPALIFVLIICFDGSPIIALSSSYRRLLYCNLWLLIAPDLFQWP